MARTQQNVFLIDGGGAIVSTTATAAILLVFQPLFGMPHQVLLRLVALALVFCVYSLSCWRLRAPIRPWLPIVVIANLAYCALLGAELALHASVLTRLGLAYFVGEIVVILGVVVFERRVLRANSRASL